MLKSFFNNTPFVCLSGTLTEKHIDTLSKQLLIKKFTCISVSPEKTNLKLIVKEKPKGTTTFQQIEDIYQPQVDQLLIKRDDFPVTLMFMSYDSIGNAMRYAYHIFGGREKTPLEIAPFGSLYRGQEEEVAQCIISDLQKENPRFRLVFTTPIIGMGFDPPAVTMVIHVKPPRSITSYLQEIGRAGRRSQAATAVLHYCGKDTAKNLPGIQTDII